MDFWEHTAVYWLLKFLDGPVYYANAQNGLSRFRRCAACSRWIFCSHQIISGSAENNVENTTRPKVLNSRRSAAFT